MFSTNLPDDSVEVITDPAHRVPERVNNALVLQYLSALDTPRSLAVWLLYSYKEHVQLVNLTIHIERDYPDYKLDEFRRDYAATSFLSKAEFLETGIDTELVAWSRFREAEEMCRATNQRLAKYCPDGRENSNQLHSSIGLVQQEIARILTPFNAHEVFEGGGWGPGVTQTCKREQTNGAYKYHLDNDITRDLHDLVAAAMPLYYPNWGEPLALNWVCRLLNWGKQLISRRFNLRRGNKLSFVKKNAKTDRSICIEPGLNLFFQKAAGLMIRRRLARAGCDLNSQLHNQRAAGRAFRDGLATEDMRMASDTIARLCVRLLVLDKRWYNLLNALRCKYGYYKEDQKHYLYWEKFSSMGNGFTFELESLIFLAVARVATRTTGGDVSDVSIYGDDVILPSSASAAFHELCGVLGFELNLDKSYDHGLFYESCGEHFFCGKNVTPFYLKQRIGTIDRVYHFHNSVSRLAQRWEGGTHRDSMFETTLSLAVTSVEKRFRLHIPDGVGDGGFVGQLTTNIRPAGGYTRWAGWEGYLYSHHVYVPIKTDFDGHGLLNERLRQIRGNRNYEQNGVEHTAKFRPDQYTDLPNMAYGNALSVRGLVRLKKRQSLTHKWQNPAPWIHRSCRSSSHPQLFKPVEEVLNVVIH